MGILYVNLERMSQFDFFRPKYEVYMYFLFNMGIKFEYKLNHLTQCNFLKRNYRLLILARKYKPVPAD